MHTPSRFATAPEGHGERIHQTPSVASRQPLRGTGKGFPEPLRSLRSESRDFVGIIYNSIPNLRLCQRSRWRSWRPGWRK